MRKLLFTIVGLIFTFATSQIANATQLDTDVSGNSGTTAASYVAYMPSSSVSPTSLSYGGTTTSTLGSFNIAVNAGSGLSSNTAAMAAFERAVSQWESRISDPITVNINANMQSFGSSTIIGQSSAVTLYDDYDEIRNAIAAAESDDQIVSYTPTATGASGFSAYLPTGFSLSGYISATKANLKAMGFTGLDSQFGVTDATITLNTDFNFDFDNSDGVTAGYMDFETVVAHEIGHALGFVSSVDTVDAYLNASQTTSVHVAPLDLFRFDNDGADDPSTESEFATFARSLVPNNDEITDQIDTWGDTDAEYRMSTGAYTGDGSQASHWKDDLGIGIMDPTLGYQEVVGISEADFRAFDLIGYDITPVPEPGQLIMLLGMAVSMFVWRRVRR